jgi:hypothetical protein
MALERLAPIITDADTSRNLRWQQSVTGDATKLALWKIEATSSIGLQFYAYMQPGEAFMVVGHSMSTIYSTTTDIATLHGKVVLFTGDCKRTRECIPIILPPQSSFEWKKCSVIDEKEKITFVVCQQPVRIWQPVGANNSRWDKSRSTHPTDDCSSASGGQLVSPIQRGGYASRATQH